MADTLLRVVARLPRVTGTPEDAITNTWYFDGDDSDEDQEWYWSAATDLLVDFYEGFDTYLSGALSGALFLTVYDMRDAEPRVPKFTQSTTLTVSAGAWLPAEVALCLSFQAAAVSGTPQARRRGRVFLGPLSQDAIEASGGDIRPTQAMREGIANLAGTLKAGRSLPLAAGSLRWAVYSPTLDAGGSVDDAFNDVSSGWIDNAFDTQRRRGAAPTARTTF